MRLLILVVTLVNTAVGPDVAGQPAGATVGDHLFRCAASSAPALAAALLITGISTLCGDSREKLV